MIGLGLDGYEPDSGHESAIAFRIRVVEAEQYIPAHSHRKGQLILALHGALTCEVENAMWMVPPQYAVWVPGQLSHSNRATPGAQVCFLFIEPGAAPMPDRCCTLKISPLVRELILTLAERGGESLAAPATARLVQVLFDELPRQPQEHLQLPVSNHPKIRQMVTMMAEESGALADPEPVGGGVCDERAESGPPGSARNGAELSPLAPSAAADPRAAAADPRADGAADGSGAGLRFHHRLHHHV
ncbi:AraC family transcriptional regulator [Klebsiella pneumoniae]|uniref:AraC family transcriptional regulator n=1 Tax=Klebsiella pneumoniae TaxID=573 RepID=A0A377XSY6_KLEPN|nr:AraC family transcriptional regulator [Klebsiella pneumoniae]